MGTPTLENLEIAGKTWKSLEKPGNPGFPRKLSSLRRVCGPGPVFAILNIKQGIRPIQELDTVFGGNLGFLTSPQLSLTLKVSECRERRACDNPNFNMIYNCMHYVTLRRHLLYLLDYGFSSPFW
jgi:hypothetical protein